MNRKINLIGMVTLLLTLAIGVIDAQTESSYTGTVTASQLASGVTLGMLMKHLNCHDEADCARQLVKAGGKYVLVTAKGVYQLSDQKKAAQFVAMKVTVNGTLDNPKRTIEVADVQPYTSSAVSASAQ